MHSQNGGRAPLLSCPVCAPLPGASSCVPLMVGGEVIGSVLLSRPAPYSAAEEQRIRESVGQAAPVLANLRNLAVAEMRAATDGLTGLPNQRAVADALNRMFAQAAATQAPLALLMLDLDHFKQVNDQHGPPGGRSGPGRCRRGAARRAAEPGLRRPQGRGGVRDPAARHRDRRRAGASPSGSARRSPRSPSRAPTRRLRSRSASPASPATRAPWTGSSASPTRPCTWPSGRAATASSWPSRPPPTPSPINPDGPPAVPARCRYRCPGTPARYPPR